MDSGCSEDSALYTAFARYLYHPLTSVAPHVDFAVVGRQQLYSSCCCQLPNLSKYLQMTQFNISFHKQSKSCLVS